MGLAIAVAMEDPQAFQEREIAMKRESEYFMGSSFPGLVVVLAIGVGQSAFGGNIRVLAYATGGPGGEVTRLNQIGGIAAVGTADLDDVTPENLANYDVFYAASTFGTALDAKASVLRDFLFGGGGIVVGQASVTGPIDWLPSGLGASVADIWYPGGGHFVPTPSGLAHPILDGLGTGDFGSVPSDTVYRFDLEPGWDVLLVHSTDGNIVGLASGAYGGGRALLWPDRYDTGVGELPSDRFLRQAYEWVVPEPAALLLICGAAAAVLLKRRRS